jgi:hypothetical protein
MDTVGTWSRDGRSIYFGSVRSGTMEIWKIPAEGGSAVQVTRNGGMYARESWDGRHLYYTKQDFGASGIWWAPVDGGEETEVVPGPIRFFWDWALSRDGIYFARTKWVVPMRRHEYSIRFLDLGSGQVTELFRREGPFVTTSLAVSPGEEWILHCERPVQQSELMLVENFR